MRLNIMNLKFQVWDLNFGKRSRTESAEFVSILLRGPKKEAMSEDIYFTGFLIRFFTQSKKIIW